jgi:Tol biopolymer transport system component
LFDLRLHPRWNPDGTQVCFDGSHEPTRQMYVVDVGHVTQA